MKDASRSKVANEPPKEKLSDYEKQYLDHSRGKGVGLSREKKRRMVVREEMEEAKLAWQKEYEETGNKPSQVASKESQKAQARAAKSRETKKRDVDAYDDSVHDEDMRRLAKKKKVKKPRAGDDDGGLFDDEIISFSEKAKKNEKEALEGRGKRGPGAGKYSFKEFDPTMVGKFKKGANKGKAGSKFKSKSKHKRR